MGYFAMTKSAAIALLTAYGSEIESATDETIINNVVNRLDEQANEVERIAKNAYKTLGCSGNDLESMEYQLSEKIAKLRNETINLNGVELERGLLKDLLDSNVFQYDRQKEYNAFISYIENQTQMSIKDKKNEIGAIAVAELLNLTAGTIQVSNGQARYTKDTRINGVAVGGRFAGKFSSFYNELGIGLATKFDEYYKKHQNVINNFNTNVTSNNNGFQIDIQWNETAIESFLQMTNTKNKRERDRFFRDHPGLKKKILNAYKQKIIDNCPNISNIEYFKKALEEVMFATDENGEDVDAFFGLTGKNLIGRLGEVQALYYMLVLTNGNIMRKSEWVGGKGNPHADEILKGVLGEFGIQVKNTTQKGGPYEVEFQKFNMAKNSNKSAEKVKIGDKIIPVLFNYSHTSQASAALQSASQELFGTNGILPGRDDLIEAIETILGMYTFNIEYKWHDDNTKPKFYASSNIEFNQIRERIVELTQKANKLMSLMSAAVMYMQTSDLSNKEANTLYLIGGVTIISTATILRQIANDVRNNLEYEKSKFKMRTAGESTIIDVLNDKKKISQLNFALQSSYTFQI